MITNTWSVNTLERETATGRVTVVHYTVDATDGAYSAGAYGSVGLDGEISTPYSKLTPAVCIEWVKSSLGTERVAKVEAALAAQLSERAAPTKAAGVPWT